MIPQKKNKIDLHMPLAQPFTKKLITSEHVALKAIQLLPDTFFDIINSVENISVQVLR